MIVAALPALGGVGEGGGSTGADSDAQLARPSPPGRHQGACSSYLSLASGYAEAGERGTEMAFHEKVLEICESAQDMVGAAEAQGRLGRTHMAVGNVLDAIGCHEQQVAVAASIGSEAVEQKRDGQSSLITAYTAQAEDYVKIGDSASAIALYEKCLDCSRQSGDVKGEGETQHKMGLILASIGEVERSMQCQRLYRDACAAQSPPDAAGQGKACQALATAANKLGDTEAATQYLEECIELASSAEDSAAQARACASLGGLLRSQGNHGAALGNFEKFFELARASGAEEGSADAANDTGSLGLSDTARAALGVARANANFDAFKHSLQNDLGAMLAWRNRRIPLQLPE